RGTEGGPGDGGRRVLPELARRPHDLHLARPGAVRGHGDVVGDDARLVGGRVPDDRPTGGEVTPPPPRRNPLLVAYRVAQPPAWPALVPVAPGDAPRHLAGPGLRGPVDRPAGEGGEAADPVADRAVPGGRVSQ